MRWYKWTVEQFHGLRNLGNGNMIVMEKGYGGRYASSSSSYQVRQEQGKLVPNNFCSKLRQADKCLRLLLGFEKGQRLYIKMQFQQYSKDYYCYSRHEC